MFEDVDQVREMRKKYNSKMFLSGISTFRGIEELEADAFHDGVLDRKSKELIALGISISHACYG